MKRRKFILQTSVGALAALAGGSALLTFSTCEDDGGMMNMEGEAPKVLEGNFESALPKPPVVNATASLKAQPVSVVLKKGKTTPALGYHAAGILGPTIEVGSGETLSVNFENGLSEASNIHWHGLLAPAAMDGHPSDLVQPGASFTYTFPVTNQAGTYWYHPHPDLATAKQAYLGLAGFFIVRDAEEAALGLPAGDFELPIVIQDKLLGSDGKLTYSPADADLMNGLLGNYVLVNSVHAPVQNVATRTYRLRILNGSNGRIYNLALSNGAAFNIIGSDAGLLAAPLTATEILLSPGERVDVLVDFSSTSVGSEVFLESKTFTGSEYQGKQAFRILKFRVTQSQTDPFNLPAALSNYLPIAESEVNRHRDFDISNGGGHGGHGGGMAMHNINGKSYDHTRIDETALAGTIEEWTFDNAEGVDPHPMHLHGSLFQVLDRTGGRGQVFPHEKGWKDTVLVMPGETVRIIGPIGQNKGVYVFHCHNLEHEDTGMMLQMEIQ